MSNWQVERMTAEQNSFVVFLGPKSPGKKHTMPQKVEPTPVAKDNEQGDYRVECFGLWTKWKRVGFAADNFTDALEKAYDAFAKAVVPNVPGTTTPEVALTTFAEETMEGVVPASHAEGDQPPLEGAAVVAEMPDKTEYEKSFTPVPGTKFPAKVKNLGPKHDAAVAAAAVAADGESTNADGR